VALTAAAVWVVAQTQLAWAQTYARDPALAHQLEVEVLPALSTANVRELLRAVLPLPPLTLEQAMDLVIMHLFNLGFPGPHGVGAFHVRDRQARGDSFITRCQPGNMALQTLSELAVKAARGR
jgi:hypothetical protein